MKCLIVLVGKDLKCVSEEYLDDEVEETKSLLRTLGWEVKGVFVSNLRYIDPGFYVTRGKLEEIKALSRDLGVESVVFYNDLSPVQIRNLENELGRRVFTRVDVILAIFKEHAISTEAKLQVELATLRVQLPRLYGVGKEMEQMKGGIGLRGPGERKTEVMKRHIKEKIRSLEKKIREIKRNRLTQVGNRKEVFNVSIVGYTNSGKSTLMNALTRANVIEEDKLFSTLETKTRRVFVDGVVMTITDTVGFIRDLPHQLVESFYSTLEVVKRSDLLLHVVDISSRFVEDKIRVVDSVLQEIFSGDGLQLPSVLYVFNKVDLVEEVGTIDRFTGLYPDSLFVSAKERVNIEALRQKLKSFALRYYEAQSYRHCFL